MAGLKDKITGKTKERVGKLTHDGDLEAEGAAQNASGKIQEVVGKVEGKAKHFKDGLTGR
jgi:uncharacterized protein YjbJ (UPF0337 family)